MFQEIIIHIIAFLGLLVGFVIAHHSWDEMQLGDKYFRILRNIMLILITVFLLYKLKFELYHYLLIIIGIVIGIVIKWKYLYLGVAGVASLLTGDLILIPALIFLLGLPEGTLNYYHHKKEKLKLHTIYRLVLFLIPLIFLAFPIGNGILNAFAAGAVITQIR